jgi:Xaa-Pro dipeptidase
MLSRRRFVQTSSLALTGTACGVASGTEGGAEESLPPSIAALTSMKDQATPISVDERRGRIEKAKRLMAENRIDAVMLTGGTSMVYFTGMQWGLSERMTAVVIPAKGDAFIVTPKFEEERTLEQARTGPLGAATRVMTWEEHDNPGAMVAQGLRAAGIASGTVGMEETVRFTFSNMVALAAPSLRITSGNPVTAGCRMVKGQHELALMRLASQVTLKAYEAAWKALADGMTQTQFADLVAKAHRQLGFDGGAGVQVGEYSALPHGSVQPQVIKEGTILLIDGGCKVEGYSSDISRTFVLGRATDRMKSVFDLEHKAQSAALAAAKPGVECQAVDAAARKVIEDGGFGPDYKFFTHRVGHGMGMDGHEWPYLVRGNTLKLAPGMTFSDEPGIYIPGEFGCRLEDDMVITETGAELFTPQSQSLEQPF